MSFFTDHATDDFLIKRTRLPLAGELVVEGSKNAALPLIVAASLMPNGGKLRNVPRIADVKVQIALLKRLGATAELKKGVLDIAFAEWGKTSELGTEALMSRGSVYVIAAAVLRGSRVVIPGIGGDRLQGRDLKRHFAVLRGFGLDVREQGTGLEIFGLPPRAGVVDVNDRPGGITPTALALLIAAFCDGVSDLLGISREPEVLELADYLRSAGIEIIDEGPNRLRVRGPAARSPDIWSVSVDRVAFGTYAAAAVATGGHVRLPRLARASWNNIISPFVEAGCSIKEGASHVEIKGPPRYAFSVMTGPFPMFPSDLGPPLISMMAVAPGLCRLSETIYPDRFDHVRELIRTGLDAAIDGATLHVRGGGNLTGGYWRATGIRESAALVLSGLIHNRESRVFGASALRRGYEDLPAKLRDLGAQIFDIGESGADPLMIRPGRRSS
ncbi:hypothetical protein QA649_04305 [Bradyrhizobium sp. CB1717]|uniref:hypothetical protein n=1 Tax=Bradyrhizobium sp. CB1717 TaxID=3039154 RepID=UPI0024B05B02|nr:hypothetical protein [Bradyrhizobium sp. CB1717]WFU25473.1 hypothetical protein QA649_04305 [Bradyrhizobium sp. CB1717]